MILYVNGDSHCVGHGINVEFGMTQEDPCFEYIKQAPHPKNFQDSFGYQIAQQLNLSLVCQASSGSSLERCLRTTQNFIFQTNNKVFVLLGIPALNREEWYYQNKWWQITKGDANRYPIELHTRFKNWLISVDSDEYKKLRTQIISTKITTFTKWLSKHNIPHILFSTVEDIPDLTTPVYSRYLETQGFKADKWHHFKSDAHSKWAEYLEPKIYDIICKR